MEWVLILTMALSGDRQGGASVAIEKFETKSQCLSVAKVFLNGMGYSGRDFGRYISVKRKAKCIKVEPPKE